MGSDVGNTSRQLKGLVFQSTLPVWGATRNGRPVGQITLISIHAPRVGSDGAYGWKSLCRTISIHAPRVGSDLSALSWQLRAASISIHAPRVGSDQASLSKSPTPSTFQSTLPVWGATFYPSPIHQAIFISIHAPRVGSDC